MKKNINLTNSQIELIMNLIQVFLEIQKITNPKKYSTENELHKIAEYTDLYEILAEQYYEDKKQFRKIS